MPGMYAHVAILFLSHAMRPSFERSIPLLVQLGCITSSLGRVRFISGHIKAYSPNDRGDCGNTWWFSQRNRARRLSEFEALAFRETKKVFFSPIKLPATLDDDLHGTRESDNQVKSLSNRKADRKGVL